MAYSCDICGKGKQYGHNVSFSQRKTQKVWKPNLQRQTIDLAGGRLQVKMCTQCLRTLKKYRQQDSEQLASTTLPPASVPAPDQTPAEDTAIKPAPKRAVKAKAAVK